MIRLMLHQVEPDATISLLFKLTASDTGDYISPSIRELRLPLSVFKMMGYRLVPNGELYPVERDRFANGKVEYIQMFLTPDTLKVVKILRWHPRLSEGLAAVQTEVLFDGVAS